MKTKFTSKYSESIEFVIDYKNELTEEIKNVIEESLFQNNYLGTIYTIDSDSKQWMFDRSLNTIGFDLSNIFVTNTYGGEDKILHMLIEANLVKSSVKQEQEQEEKAHNNALIQAILQ